LLHNAAALILFSGAPLHEFQLFKCTTDTIIFVFKQKNRKLDTLADSGDEFYNVDSNAAH
jgi:hypothetical protein